MVIVIARYRAQPESGIVSLLAERHWERYRLVGPETTPPAAG